MSRLRWYWWVLIVVVALTVLLYGASWGLQPR